MKKEKAQNSRGNRIEFLSRKNKGYHIKTTYLKKLGEAIGQTPDEKDIIHLESSDKLETKFFQQTQLSTEKKVSFIKRFHYADNGILAEALSKLQSKLGDTKCLLFSDYSQYVGAYRISLKQATDRFLELIDFDGNSLNISDEDVSNGLIVDLHEEFDQSKSELCTYLELIVWGTKWTDLIEESIDIDPQTGEIL